MNLTIEIENKEDRMKEVKKRKEVIELKKKIIITVIVIVPGQETKHTRFSSFTISLTFSRSVSS